MNKEQIIYNTIQFVKQTLEGAEGGHDWFHIERVYKNVKQIASGEDVDLFIVSLGALLHDIADVRVHISIPEQGLFRDADARASAAVTLVTRSGNPLEAGRVEGVQRLVSAAVPRLPVENVVILDAAGTIVSPTPLPEELPATELELASATTAPTEEGVPGDALPIEANADAAPDNGVNASVEDSSAEADAPAAPETALTAQSELTDQPPVLLAAPDRPSTRWQDLGWQDVSQAEGVSTTPLSDQLAAESVSPGLLQSVSRLGPQIIWLVIVSLVIVLMILIYRRLQRPTLADIELEALVDRLKARLRAPQDEALGGDPGNQALSTFAALAPADQRAVRARLEPFEQSMLDYAGREAPASAAPTQIAQGRTRFSDVLQDRIQAATGSKPSDGSKMTARARAALRAAAEATAPAKPREEAAS